MNGLSDSHFHSLLARSVDYRDVFEKLRIGIDVSASLDDCAAILEEVKEHANIFAAVGAGPWCARDCLDKLSFMNDLRLFSSNEKVVAIGEIGLDYHDGSYAAPACQKDLFLLQLQFACDNCIPVILHVRNSFDDVYEIVRDFSFKTRNMLHCFTGDRHVASKFLDLGYYISFGGPVTYKGNDSIRDAAVFVPDDSIVVETDSPYLSPVPLRGRENSPLNTGIICSFISSLRSENCEEFVNMVGNNLELFSAERRKRSGN